MVPLCFSFGCGTTGNRTGIVFNSGIDDFSFPGQVNYFGLPASPSNFIEPHKQAVTSMAPVIVVDRNGQVRIVLGATGGTKIPTAIAMVS